VTLLAKTASTPIATAAVFIAIVGATYWVRGSSTTRMSSWTPNV